MHQTELFKSAFSKEWHRIANGCYGTVYAKHDGDWVVKNAANDGTRTYLEWVMLKTRRGERMRGMPMVDFVVAISDDRYMMGMKRYRCAKSWLAANKRPDYINDLVKAFHHDCPAISCNDMHTGNMLLDGKTLILTDPSSSAYRPVGARASRWTVPSGQEHMVDSIEVQDWALEAH